ncbi:MAG: hypothetical protein MI747_14905 [Desulfobacterales bacterium]|nr:hypothetical protein [Desulfobacterales bacterium]
MLVILFTLCLVNLGEAFVPQTPHLLHMVVRKIKRPVGIQCFQTRSLIREDGEEELFYETLRLGFPDRFRSEVRRPGSDEVLNLTVQSGDAHIRVGEDQSVSIEQSPLDYAMVPLLFRDALLMTKALKGAGVHIDAGALRRYQGQVCYVIGKPDPMQGDPLDFPSLWIDKESLMPLRYLIRQGGHNLEFRYGNWQQVSKSWYPLETDILMDGKEVVRIRVEDLRLSSEFSPELFDVAEIKALSVEPAVDNLQ